MLARGSSSAIAPCSRTAGFSSVPDGRLPSKPGRAGAGAVRDDPRRAPVGRLHGHQDLRASWRGRLLAGHVQLRTCRSACRDSFGEFLQRYCSSFSEPLRDRVILLPFLCLSDKFGQNMAELMQSFARQPCVTFIGYVPAWAFR